MCGIAGIIDNAGLPNRPRLERARDALSHRGPDDIGVFINSSGNAALLFRRLAVIDLSPSGHQPMKNEDESLWIVFNGEVYNYLALRATLEQTGHRFRSSTDTEVILHAYEEWGPECVERFIGMFAFAIWDDHSRTLFAARDRLGIKPFYYQMIGQGLRFSSELKPLLMLSDVQPTLDKQALWEYLNRGYIRAPHSIFSSIRSLVPGHWLLWHADRGLVTLKRYWDPVGFCADDKQIEQPTLSEATEELDKLLRSSVSLRLISDVPLGAFLSGGIDSSTVVALMAAISPTQVKTFTIGFREKRFNEADSARQVARHLGTDHYELYATEQEALDFIPRIPEYYDEPFADSSAIPTYLVCKLARRHVTVALSGDGGDELFCGYQHYRTIAGRWNQVMPIPTSLRKLFGSVGPCLSASPAQIALSSLAYTNIEGFFDYYTSLWRPYELKQLVPSLAQPPFSSASRMPIPNTFLDLYMLSDLQRYLPNDILTKVDRASMAVSLEARVPLLDHRVIEQILRLPLDYKYRLGQQKIILREVLYRYVPRELVDRPKSGFGVPLDDWLRGQLKWMFDEYLNPTRLKRQGLFDPTTTCKIVRRFIDGHIGHSRVWVLLMFQLWAERYGIE